jgi:hypothetical protein
MASTDIIVHPSAYRPVDSENGEIRSDELAPGQDKISSNSQYTQDTLQNYANLRRSPNRRKEALVRKRKSSTKRSRIRGARRSVHEEFWSTRYLFLHVESGPGASPLAISGPFSHAMDRHSLRQPSGYRRKVASGPTHGHVLQVCQTICYLAWRMDRLRL